MIRRLSLLSALTLVPLVVPITGSAAAAGDVPVHKFVGAWTPDESSGKLLAGHAFSIQFADSADAAAQDIGPANQKNFANNCDPKVATDISYFVITYSWKPGPAPMGGCYSSITTPHIEFWGRQSDYGELRQASDHGERVITGEWDIYDDQLVVHKHKFTAHHPVALFRANAKRRAAVKHSDHVYRETEVSGVGTARLEFLATSADCKDRPVEDGDGAFSLSETKVGGPNVVDFYDVKFKVIEPEAERFRECPLNQSLLGNIPIRVTKSDPSEKERCPVDATGTVHLVDHGTATTSEGFAMRVPKCDIDLFLKHAPGASDGDRVNVAIDVNENGY